MGSNQHQGREAGTDASARTRVIEGVGSLLKLGAEVSRFGRRVLLVSDPGLRAAGLVDQAERVLESAGLDYRIWCETEENPTTTNVDQCAQVLREFEPEVLVGFGGGSSIDVLKGANFVWRGGGVLKDYHGHGSTPLNLAPLIAVPTTAGTGTEVQSFALIGDAVTHSKMACGHPEAAPRVAILDPALTVGLPPFVTASTGLDAIGHALEVAVTKAGNDTSLAFATEAFGLAAIALPRVLEAPQDVIARGKMLRAATLAGRGIENSMLGAAHSMANPLTARFGLVHGQAVGTALPLVVAYNLAMQETAEPYRQLASAAGLVGDGASAPEVGHEILGLLDRLLDQSGFPRSFTAHGIKPEDCEALGREAAEQWTAQFNPRPIGADEFTHLFQLGLER